jgi:hypothetical protein
MTGVKIKNLNDKKKTIKFIVFCEVVLGFF